MQLCRDEVGVFQKLNPSHVGTVEIGSAQVAVKDCANHGRLCQGGMAAVCPRQIGHQEEGPAQVRASQVSELELGALKCCVAEFSLPRIRAFEGSAGQE